MRTLQADKASVAVFSLERIWGAHLSQRELEVGRLLVSGRSTQEIAAALFISENTVKTHLRNLYRKTKTRSRVELYRVLMEAGSAPARIGSVAEDMPAEFERIFAALHADPEDSINSTVVVLHLAFLQSGLVARVPGTSLTDLLATSIRSRDHLLPWRDDLYLLVLPGSDRTTSIEVADRLIRKVKRWAERKRLRMRAAVGAATIAEGSGTPQSVVELAAQRLRHLEQVE